MRIKDISESERPREKLLSLGASVLSNGELLAILLRTGTRTDSALDVAQKLLASAGGTLSGLFCLSREKICSIPGIKKEKAASLVAAMELGRRFVSEEAAGQSRPLVGPRMVYDEMLPRLKAVDHEECWLVLLNASHYRTGRERISVGGMDSTVLDVRKVVKLALDRNAPAVILVHNHPGSSPHPSHADIRRTQDLSKALKAFDIDLLDHVIVSDGSFFSFADDKLYTG